MIRPWHFIGQWKCACCRQAGYKWIPVYWDADVGSIVLITKGVTLCPSHPVSGFAGEQMQWLPSRLLSGASLQAASCLWSENVNELHQLQVHICSFIHRCSFVRYKYKGAKHPFPNGHSEILTYTRIFYLLACLSLIDVFTALTCRAKIPVHSNYRTKHMNQ